MRFPAKEGCVLVGMNRVALASRLSSVLKGARAEAETR